MLPRISFKQHWLLRYALALAAVSVSLLAHLALTAWVGPGLPAYITFYPAVMLVALLGGFGSGLLATLVSALVMAYWVLPPVGLAVEALSDLVGLALFSGMGVFMSVVAELYRRARRRAAAHDTEVLLREAQAAAAPFSRQGLLLNAGLALSLAILGAAGWQSLRNLAAMAEASRWTAHTHQVIQQLDHTLSTLESIESDQRGYLISGKDEYLAPFQARLSQVGTNLGALKQLTQDNPGQEQRLTRLESLIHQMAAGWEQSVRLRRAQGLQTATAVSAMGAGETLMDSVRQEAAEVRHEEERLLQQRVSLRDTSRRRTLQALLGGGVFSLFVLAGVFLFLKQENARRVRAEAEVRHHRDHLQDLVAIRTADLDRANAQLKQEIAGHEQAKEDLRQRVVELQAANEQVRTSRRAAINLMEDALQARQQAEHASADLQKLNRVLQALRNSSQTMIRAASEADYLQEVCRIIIQDCGHAMVWAGFAQEDEAKTIRPIAHAGFEEGYLETLNLTWADTERGRGPTGTAIRSGRPCVCYNMLTDPAFEPWRAEAVKRDYASSVTLPLLADGKSFGALAIYSKQPDAFSQDELNLLSQLAADVSYCIAVLRTRRAQARAEEALRQSEERYRTLIESSPDAVFINRNNRLVFVNPAALRLFGASASDQLLGRAPLELFHPDDHAVIQERIRRLLAGERQLLSEEKILRLDGSAIEVEVLSSPLADRSGPAIQVILRDISQRKRAEEQLRLLSTAVESAVNGITITDRKGRILWVNPAFTRLTGYAPEEVLGQNPRLLKSGCHSAEFYARMWATILRGEPWQGEMVNRRKDGSLYDEEMTIAPVRAGSGEITHFVAIKQDVTERKRAQEELRKINAELEQRVAERTAEVHRQSRLLRAFFEHSLDSLVFLDKHFNFIQVNEAYARACQRGAAEFRGHNHFEFYPHAENQAIFENVVRTKTPYQVTAKPFTFPDHPEWGVSYWDWALVPILDAQGEVDFLVFSLRDVTKRELAEQKVRAASRYARSLLEASLDPLVTISPEGRITDVNQATELATGMTRERLIGSAFAGLFAEPEQADAGYRKVLQEGLVRDYPLTICHVSGETTDVLYNATVYRNEAGEVQGVFAAARDITERKRMEEELRAASIYARSLLEASLDPLVTISPEGKITDANRATELVTGLPRERLIGSDFSGYFTDPEKASAGYRQVLAEGQVRDYPLTIRHLSGQTTDVLYNATVYRNERGEVQGVFAAARDITERKRMERALQESEARYRSLVTATSQVVWTTDPQGRIAYEVSTWQAFTGQTFDQYKALGWAEAIHPDDRPVVQAAWLSAVANRSLYETGYRLRRYDGQYRHVIARGVPVLEPDGSVREWIGTCTDITPRREAERRREFTSALLALFARKATATDYLNSVVEIIRQWSGCQALGIRVKNDQEQIPYESSAGFEPGFLELEHRLSLQHDSCLCIRAISQTLEEPDRPLLTPGGSFRSDDAIEFANRLSPGQLAHYRGNCMKFGFASLAVIPIRYREEVIGAIHLADRRPGQFPPASVEFIESITPLIGEALHRFQTEAELARHRDHLEVLVHQRTSELETANARLQVEVAERRRAQEALQQTAEDLQRSNRDLEQFAYVASHDLQEPLRAVGGYVKLLQRRFEAKLDAKGLEFINGAVEGATRMERLITDLLAFSRVGTRGQVFAPTDLNTVLGDALQNLQMSLKTAQARITRDALPTLPVDGTQLTQLFQNLIGNAIKFRGERPPQIHVGAQQQAGRWVVSVRDNGIGIDPQYFERIFQIFQRLHTRKYYPGTGIGLAICKRIVERHGGAIWVESQPGQGSTFCFSLPVAPGKDHPVQDND